MNSESDFNLAQEIAKQLDGKFWQVTVGEWWVVVESVSSQKLVVLTNDPLGISFSHRGKTIGMEELRRKVLQILFHNGIIGEDGSWTASAA